MELRSFSHLHFIQSIRGSSVVKMLNVDSRGRPALMFKKVKDIYETEDAKNLDSLSTLQPKDAFRGFHFDSDRDKIGSPCLVMGEEKTIKNDPEIYDFNCSVVNDEKESDLDDLIFGNMTLKQLKKRCKTKKRKPSKSVDSTKENVETCFSLKQDYSDSQPEDDEFDLKEPLSSWKSKLTKKRKCINKCVSSSSQSAISVKSEEIRSNHDLLHSSKDLQAPINVKVEVLQPDNSDCENMACVVDDSSIDYNEQVGSCGVLSSEMLKSADECVLGSGELISSTKESTGCVVNEVYYDHLDHAEPNSIPNVTALGGETMKVDDPDMTSHQSSVFSLSELKKQEDFTHPPFHGISPEIVSPPEDHGSDGYDNSLSHSFPHETSWKINSCAGVQRSDLAIDNSLQCVELSHGSGACVFKDDSEVYLPSNNEACAISSPVSNCSSSWNSNSCLSPDTCLVSVDDGSPTTVEKQSLMSDTGYSARNCSARIHPCDSSASNSNPCVNPDSCLVSVDDGSPTTDEKQSLISASGYIARNCAARIHLCYASDELSTLEVVGDDGSEAQHPPERLFSTRKAISPTSQERLCKAMDAIELHDDIKNYKCRENLSFEKQTECEVSSAGSDLEGAEEIINTEGPGQINRAEVTINCKQIISKRKNGLKGSHPKGILKVSHISHALPRVSTGCSSIQSCAESAIAFSQRQMLDIESLAIKLTKELKSMRDIVEETLQSKACPTTSLKYNVDEVRATIDNAAKVEETTRKWLSMMARDCSRFCKIMRLTEKGTVNNGNTALPKERKKITFADEAGGKLCHVKFFEDGMAQNSVFSSE